MQVFTHQVSNYMLLPVFSIKGCWSGGRHPSPCAPTTRVAMPPPPQVLRKVSGSPLGMARPSFSEGFEIIISNMPKNPSNSCPFLPDRIHGITLFWISLNLCWMRDRRSLGEWDHFSCFASRFLNYLFCLQQGCCRP